MTIPSLPHISALRIQNYRVLKNLELTNLTPLSVFIGSNGSGKSTLLEALTFLSACFQNGLTPTCQKYGSLTKLKTHNTHEPIQFQITYTDPADRAEITYTLAIQETPNHQPYIETETLQHTCPNTGTTELLLNFANSQGWVIEYPNVSNRQEETFSTPDVIAANTLGQFTKYPYLQTLRQFIIHWFTANLTHLNTQTLPDAAPTAALSSTGDNLTNLIDHLQTQQPEQFQTIVQTLTRHIPRLTNIQTLPIQGRRRLHIQDQNNTPLPADQASDGTLLLLAYLLLLQIPSPHQLILVDEPENNLHPKLLTDLAEQFRAATAHQQILVTTHSPYFVDTLRPQELWIFHRESDGYTQACSAAEIHGVTAFIDNGALLGDLWMENFLSLKNTSDRSRSA
jgi:predicted ATPase